MSNHAVRTVVMVLAVTGVGAARADGPTMTILSIPFVSDYDPGHQGDELNVTYLVTNTSPPNADNNMIEFRLPAGSHQGVYEAVAADGWSVAAIDLNETWFVGLMVPGHQGVFELYSTCLGVGQAAATATAQEDLRPFTPVLVDVPRRVGDLNVDGVVNGDDFVIFADCLGGPGVAPASGCAVADLDGDDDVDLADFAVFQTACGA